MVESAGVHLNSRLKNPERLPWGTDKEVSTGVSVLAGHCDASACEVCSHGGAGEESKLRGVPGCKVHDVREVSSGRLSDAHA